MIQSLDIQNYQSHRKTHLEFSPGVSAIIGPSDSGKTAILRAIRWVIENRPRGDAFRSFWGGTTSVKVTTPQAIIERQMDKTTVNLYRLITEKDDLIFTAMGTNVPEEVQNTLNISSINAQYQLDRPFLLDDSPGEVASHFNSIAHLDIIDTGIKHVKRILSAEQKTFDFEKRHLKELQDEHAQYAYLDDMEKDIIVGEKLQTKLKDTQSKLEVLENLRSGLIQIAAKIQRFDSLLKLEKPVVHILDRFTALKKVKDDREDLSEKIQKLHRIDKAITAEKRLLKLSNSVTYIFTLKEKENRLQNEKTLLSRLISTIKTNITSLKTAEEQQIKLQKEFDENFPNECPLCGSVRGKRK